MCVCHMSNANFQAVRYRSTFTVVILLNHERIIIREYLGRYIVLTIYGGEN